MQAGTTDLNHILGSERVIGDINKLPNYDRSKKILLYMTVYIFVSFGVNEGGEEKR